MMGLDPAALSLSGYFEALEAHNEAHSPDEKGERAPVDHERLARLNKALGIGG
ncbi:hypothetical protein [Sphingosinicella xenopeptidilytica]|uniref:Uncharacterized protein n=1 Tax=Sphingosinicella xenopeptidilytica TaxID=364098 RepID=A0ABW3C275_SPHXN